MGSLFSPLAQLLLGSLIAPSSRMGAGALKRLLIAVLGLVVATLLACFALVVLTFALVFWVMPPSTGMLEICLLTAMLLIILAYLVWQFTSRGQMPHELLEEALQPPPSGLGHLGHTAQRIVSSFTRGWETPLPPERE